LASFSRALMQGLSTPDSGDTVGIVRVVSRTAGDRPTAPSAVEVVGHLDVHGRNAHRAAAATLNTFDVAVVQHEYGIYGGADGDQLLDVLDWLRVPVVVVAHTVLERPTRHQSQVLRRVVAASDAVVTMTDAAKARLVRLYDVAPAKISVIRHGASPRLGASVSTPGTRPMILTWGLLGPGKGIEWAVDGLQRLRDLQPTPEYVVAGQTHPRVRLHAGEAYRSSLAQRASAAGVGHMLRFVDAYLDDAALALLISRADVVLLPYESREQVTSGVLVEAVAAGKPVVATAFPHAVELLTSGAGRLVPQFDGSSIGDALHQVLTEPAVARGMAVEATRLAPSLLWPAVAEQYRSLADTLLATAPRTTVRPPTVARPPAVPATVRLADRAPVSR
jgi:glycosyltransferase involved in cell wall biosynthesis